MARIRWLAPAIALLFASSAQCLVPVFTGEEDKFWTSHAVVVAKVAKVAEATRNKPLERADLELLGVVATNVLVPTRLNVSYRVGVESPLRNLHEGECVLLLIKRTEKGWVVPAVIPDFLPNEDAMVSVTNLEDPLVIRACESVAAVRERYEAQETERNKRPAKGRG
jgi:hypothetical protein